MLQVAGSFRQYYLGVLCHVRHLIQIYCYIWSRGNFSLHVDVDFVSPLILRQGVGSISVIYES